MASPTPIADSWPKYPLRDTTDLIVIAADENYFEHVKPLLVGCRIAGKFEGDFCVLTPLRDDLNYAFENDLADRGIAVIKCNDRGYYLKYNMFSPWFSRWERALYLDCDCIIQNPLDSVFSLLSPQLGNRQLIDEDCGTIRNALQNDDDGTGYKAHADLVAKLESCYNLDLCNHCAGVFGWRPCEAETDMEHKLRGIHELIRPINRHVKTGSDQPVFDLCYQGRHLPIPNKEIAFWPNADGTTAVIHYTHGFAPWLASGFLRTPQGKSITSTYVHNTRAFDEVFPKI